MIFVLCFDNPYNGWARLLLRSLMIFEPDIGVYIHGINLHKKVFNQLKNDYSNVLDITNTKVKHIPEESYRPTGKGHGWFAKMISLRAGATVAAMRRFPDEEYFVQIDTDMVVVRPLDDVKKLASENDIVIIPLETKAGGLKVSAGFLIFSRSEGSIHFLNTFHRYSIQKPYKRQLDQIALANAYKENEKWLKCGFVGYEYIDHLQKNDTFIWSAHKSISGKKKHKKKLFKNFVVGIETRPFDVDIKSFMEGVEYIPSEIDAVRKEISRGAKLYRKKKIPKYIRERMGDV